MLKKKKEGVHLQCTHYLIKGTGKKPPSLERSLRRILPGTHGPASIYLELTLEVYARPLQLCHFTLCPLGFPSLLEAQAQAQRDALTIETKCRSSWKPF